MEKKTIYILALILVIMLNERFAFVIQNSAYWPILALMLSFVLGGKKIYLGGPLKSDFRILICTLGVYLLSMIYTIVFSLQSVNSAINKYMPLLLVISAIPIASVYKKYPSEALVTSALKISSLLIALLYILQLFCYPSIIFIQEGLSVANGRIRTVKCGILLALGMLLWINDFLKKRTILSVLSTFSLLIAVVFVNRSRSLLISLLIAVLYEVVYYYYRYIGKKMKKRIRRMVLFIVSFILIILIYNYSREVIVTSFKMGESSSVKRLGAYSYYFDLEAYNHYVYGHMSVHQSPPTLRLNLVHNPYRPDSELPDIPEDGHCYPIFRFW